MGHREQPSGFTITELLIASTLLLFMIGGVFTFLLGHRTVEARGQSWISIQQNARVALETAAREIRLAGYDPGDEIQAQTPPTPIQVATDNTLTFLADVDDDGRLNRVTYRLDQRNLLREIENWTGTSFGAVVSSEIADGIGGLRFDFFDGGDPNQQLPAPVSGTNLEDIRRITIGLVADRRVGVEETVEYPVTASVDLRNP